MIKQIIGILAVAVILVSSCACAAQRPDASVEELLNLGEQYLLELDYEQALAQFLKVIELEPMNPRGYTGAAEAYLGLGDVDSAIDILEQGWGRTEDELLLVRLDEVRRLHEPASAGESGEIYSESSAEEDPYAAFSAEDRTLLDQVITFFQGGDMHETLAFLESDAVLGYLRGHPDFIADPPDIATTGTALSIQYGEGENGLHLRYRISSKNDLQYWVEAQFNRVTDGVYLRASVQASLPVTTLSETWYENAQWSRHDWEIIPIQNGAAHGIYEEYSFSSNYNVQINHQTDSTTYRRIPLQDGLYHGEYYYSVEEVLDQNGSVYTHSQGMTQNYINGTIQPVGPADGEGKLPLSIKWDSRYDDGAQTLDYYCSIEDDVFTREFRLNY